MQLYIIRHGESANNALGTAGLDHAEYLASRSPDPVLTQKGAAQAKQVAAHLMANTRADAGSEPVKSDGVDGDDPARAYGIDRLYCSAMVRALQTAQPIVDALDVPAEIWPDIHEHGGMFLGDPKQPETIVVFKGLGREAVAQRFPRFTIPSTIGADGWWDGGYESIDACEARAARVAQTLTEWAGTRAEESIALVSHGTFVDRLLKALLKQDSVDRRFFYLHYNTAITRLDLQPDGLLLMRYTNRIEHLPAELVTW